MQRTNERFVERLPLVLKRPAYAYILTLCLCGVGLLLRFMTQSILPGGYPFVSFFPVVILCAFLFGVLPGLFAAVLCGGLAWYYFIPPYGAFAFNPAVAMAMLFYSGGVAMEIALIHFMQRANYHLAVERERNRALAENRELLFHELQHRVSNNLQVVAAMLALQRRSVDHAAASRALDDAAARLALIGRISRAMYDPSGQGLELGGFLSMLTADVMEASGRKDIICRVDAPAGLQLDPAVTVPLALILAESISNAIEHGLPDRGGRIDVQLEPDDDSLILRVMDDGRGIAADTESHQGESLGLRIVHALATQLGGRFALTPGVGGGAVAMLRLPVPAVS